MPEEGATTAATLFLYPGKSMTGRARLRSMTSMNPQPDSDRQEREPGANVRYYLRFESPPLEDVTHWSVPERARWLQDHFQKRIDALGPWLQDVTVVHRFDYLLSAIVEGSTAACACLRSHLAATGNDSLVPADASFRLVESGPQAQSLPPSGPPCAVAANVASFSP